jgi:dihydropteroate synthase
MTILGILNLTRDSFFDGGRWLEPAAALEHARRLLADGADIIDIGAESSHPDSESVPADVEIARLTPVVERLIADGARVSIDTYKWDVIRRTLQLGVTMINDISALADPRSVDALVPSSAQVIIMHAIHSRPSAAARAERVDADPMRIVDHALDFFRQRIDALVAAGIHRDRLILDPGMGFFVGRDPRASLALLRNLAALRRFGLPLCISTSRKSFIGAVLGGPAGPRPIDDRGAGTLATEVWAAQQGVEYIRTHDVRALREALTMLDAIQNWPALKDSS